MESLEFMIALHIAIAQQVLGLHQPYT